MNRILAVVAPTETDLSLLKEAGTVAAATDVKVVVFALALEGSEHASVDTMRQWEGFEDVGSDESTDTVHRFAEYLGSQILDPLGVEYLAVGDVVETTRPSDKVVDVAKNHGCDHIYVANRSTSPAGKALFGDTAQSVIMNFDGIVSVQTPKAVE